MTELAWVRRPQALAAAGVVATGAARARVLAHLGGIAEQALARLTFVATGDLLVLIGATDDLPWADGVRYCAPDPVAQTLWLPTTVMPALPVDLVRRSAAGRTGDGPVLLWNEPRLFLPLRLQRSLTPALLRWLAEEGM